MVEFIIKSTKEKEKTMILELENKADPTKKLWLEIDKTVSDAVLFNHVEAHYNAIYEDLPHDSASLDAKYKNKELKK